MECNAMQCIGCNAVQCNAARCKAMEWNGMECNAMLAERRALLRVLAALGPQLRVAGLAPLHRDPRRLLLQ
eukprot:10604116-Lingulodinium_polyedra.AAC.1